MNHPDIRTYYRDKRQHWIDPNIHKSHFLGRSAMDVRWRMKTPATNIMQEGFHFELKIALPGFIKEDIKITVDDDILTVNARRKTREEPPSIYVLKEFDEEALERRFQLAKGIRHDSINAEFANGVLKITFIDVDGYNTSSHREIEIS